ncbi:formate-dependent phosphoribosylglycinamide formyltransferase [Caldivirga sp.]|jgi:phosphoribosylglycinamide formyltransferase 2|uniref:formate-dependent phosphoribosylglycinamide formyltransferase n=1 Tax=Caldivirga sp. TaxID=2080243 RepID=UPI003D12B802
MDFGTPMLEGSRRLMILGGGELGKEIAIEAQRMGVEVVVVDRYDMAPAMHVAHRRYVVDMLNGEALKAIARREKPDAVVTEIEAVNTGALIELEDEGYRIIPNAKAVKTCMNRIELRLLASEQLKLPTTKYAVANSPDEAKRACSDIGYPCLIKPEMSSSGHGHEVAVNPSDVEFKFNEAIKHARGSSRRVIVEEYVDVDRELTVLTYRYMNEDKEVTAVIPPIEHQRPKGVFHYVESWHPSSVNDNIIKTAEDYAVRIVNKLGGLGIFGVEIIITKDGRVLFSEVAPRPHDTGLVTLVSTDINEFQVHVRSALGLPTPQVKVTTPAAAHVILADDENWAPHYTGINEALTIPGVQVRLFGKPNSYRGRRMGIVLATGSTIREAIEKARKAASLIKVRILS